MPHNLVKTGGDERIYKRAEAVAEKQRGKVKDHYGLVNYIFQRMKGKKKK